VIFLVGVKTRSLVLPSACALYAGEAIELIFLSTQSKIRASQSKRERADGRAVYVEKRSSAERAPQTNAFTVFLCVVLIQLFCEKREKRAPPPPILCLPFLLRVAAPWSGGGGNLKINMFTKRKNKYLFVQNFWLNILA
jgi:hypothetical protein